MQKSESARSIREIFKSWIALDFIRFTWRYRPRQDGMHYECTLEWHKHSLLLSIPLQLMADAEAAVEAFKEQLSRLGHPGLILPRHLFEQRRKATNPAI